MVFGVFPIIINANLSVNNKHSFQCDLQSNIFLYKFVFGLEIKSFTSKKIEIKYTHVQGSLSG